MNDSDQPTTKAMDVIVSQASGQQCRELICIALQSFSFKKNLLMLNLNI